MAYQSWLIIVISLPTSTFDHPSIPFSDPSSYLIYPLPPPQICIANELCGCPTGQKRAGPEDQCRPVESWTIPLWVLRRDRHNLVFNETFANPRDQLNREYVRLFESGVAQCYPHTTLR